MSDGADGTAAPTATLTAWLGSAQLSDVPDNVVSRALHLTLDGIACALIGARLPWSTRAVRAVSELDGEGSATLIGWGRALPPTSAALLNGAFVQGFEFDDKYGPLHNAAIVLPAALATADGLRAAGRGVDGATLTLGLVLGYEVGPRLSAGLNGPALNKLGWSAGVFGALAGAAAAAGVRGLDHEGFDDALGNAGTAASGVAADQFESMAKRMGHGLAARNGVVAAALAEAGYTGIKKVLERPRRGITTFGFGVQPDLASIVAELGTRWEQLNIVFKPYASGGGTHAAVDALLSAHDQGVQAEDVTAIRIMLSERTFSHNGWRLARPATELQAQINLGYAACVALLDGNAGAEQFTPQRLERDDVWELLARAEVVHEPELDGIPSMARGVRVEIACTDGRTTLVEIADALGTKRRPMSNEQVRAKFRRASQGLLPRARVEAIERAVLGLPELNDSGELSELLREPVKPLFGNQ